MAWPSTPRSPGPCGGEAAEQHRLPRRRKFAAVRHLQSDPCVSEAPKRQRSRQTHPAPALEAIGWRAERPTFVEAPAAL